MKLQDISSPVATKFHASNRYQQQNIPSHGARAVWLHLLISEFTLHLPMLGTQQLKYLSTCSQYFCYTSRSLPATSLQLNYRHSCLMSPIITLPNAFQYIHVFLPALFNFCNHLLSKALKLANLVNFRVGKRVLKVTKNYSHMPGKKARNNLLVCQN